MINRGKVWALALLAVVSAPVPALAINAHFLHGVGAVNASMGGVGVAVPSDVLSALHNNPALLTRLDGHDMSFSILMLEGDSELSSEVQTPFGPFGGTTKNDSDVFMIPAFGWSRNVEDRPFAYGMGMIGMAGFASDFAQDPANPILLPQPQGFGDVTSRYELLQMPFAYAYEVSDRLALGLALVGGYETLQAAPFGGVAPDCISPTSCVFPDLGEDGAFGVGVRLGVFFQATEQVSLGATYTSRQYFEDFTWNTTVAHPGLPTFGTARKERFNVDVPQTLAVGIGFTPTDRFKIGLDGRWINYEDTDGFRSGFNPATGAARGLAWEDIVIVSIGGEYRFGERAAFRFGYNLSESAITDQTLFFNIASPAQFEDTVTVGVGLPLYRNLNLDLGYYHVFNTEESGPFQSPFGPVPGTRVSHEISADALLVTFSFSL